VSARTIRVRLAKASLDVGERGRWRIAVERWPFLHVASGEGSAKKEEGQTLHGAGSLGEVLLAVPRNARSRCPAIAGPECESR